MIFVNHVTTRSNARNGAIKRNISPVRHTIPSPHLNKTRCDFRLLQLQTNRKENKFGFLTLHRGAEQPVADVGPPEVHPHHGQRDGKDPGPRGPEREVHGVAAGPAAAPEGGDGEPHEEREGCAREREAGAVGAEVPRRPGEGQGGRERLVLVHGPLLRRDRAPLGVRRGEAPVPRRRRREVAVARPSHPPRACHGDGGEGVLGQGEREREEARVEGRGGEGGGSHSGKGRRAASAGVVSWEATARRRFLVPSSRGVCVAASALVLHFRRLRRHCDTDGGRRSFGPRTRELSALVGHVSMQPNNHHANIHHIRTIRPI